MKFRSSIPGGMRVYEYGVEVAGVRNRYYAAKRFVRRSNRKLYLQREPGSRKNPAAIRVIGKSQGWLFEARRCIGYVPADIARKLVVTGIEGKVQARLQMIYIEDRNSSYIRFDILGPKDNYAHYASRKNFRGPARNPAACD
jgi:hypothetical protein